ncbi:MAG: MFS transporter [Deltaproteobacteria bacterium]
MGKNDFQESGDNSTRSFRSQLGPLLFLAAIFFLNFLSRIILAPLMPTIEQDLNVSHSQAGFLFLLISLGYFPSLMGSGFVSARLTHRKTILLSCLSLGMTLIIVSQFRSLWAIRAGLLLMGLTGGLYIPSGIATLTSLVSSRHWGKAVAVHELAPNVSFLAAPLISGAFLHWLSWRGILGVLGVVALFSGAVFARFGKGGEFPGEAPNPRSIRILYGHRTLWIMMLLFGLGVGGSMGVYTMLPLYLVVEKGFELNWANTLIAISRVSVPGNGPYRSKNGIVRYIPFHKPGHLSSGRNKWALSCLDHCYSAPFGCMLFSCRFCGSLADYTCGIPECGDLFHHIL